MTAKEIERAVIMRLSERHHMPIVTRFTGTGMYECDVLGISSAGYSYEFEIKVSRSDYKADFKKDKHRYMSERLITRDIFGHKRISTKEHVWAPETHLQVANYFSFVTPPGLISIDEVPEYAGLYHVNERGYMVELKAPPKLHSIKANENLLNQIMRRFTNMLVYGALGNIEENIENELILHTSETLGDKERENEKTTQ